MLRFLQKKLLPVNVSDDMIVAMADGEQIDLSEVDDEVFSNKMLGDSIAFRYDQDKVTICSPANGVLSVLYPSGHAFGIHMNNGVELLVHIGIDTVKTEGFGFKIKDKQQGNIVKAGDPIVEVDLKKLSLKYEMDTILIIVEPNGKHIRFKSGGHVLRGQPLIEV